MALPNYISFILLIFLFAQCNERKETTSSENDSNSTTEMDTSEETSETIGTPMVNSDGSVNATLKCEGKSEITTLLIASKKRNTENFSCSISKNKNLSITFIDNEQNLELIFTLHGAGELNINLGEYSNVTAGSTQYAEGQLNSKDLGKLSMGDFTGSITLIDHGMSSNVLCGKFEITDEKGNKYVGTFNEMITSF